MQDSRALISCLLSFAISVPAAEKGFLIAVEAGDFDRRGTVIEFTLPDALRKEERLYLQLADKAMHVQADKHGQAVFICDELKRGKSATYELSVGIPPSLTWTVNAARDAFAGTNKVALRVLHWPPPRHMRGSLVMAYQPEPGAFPREDIKPLFHRGGYLHPIHTPSGKLITDDFPPNHIHHHGVWWAWTNTEFDGRKPDFWNMGDGKGRVEFVALEGTWGGPVHGGFRSRHRFVDLTAPSAVTALNETWDVRTYVPSGDAVKYWMFDLVSEQECATTNALKLPENRYGGIGIRGNWAWNGKDKTMFLTSEGETDREKGHATRGRWCDMGGMVDGSRVGIAILGHPDNFRAPQPMRIHPTEPFFNFAPQQAGDMEIKPGDKYVSRYRFVVHDGPPDKAELDRLWNDYAHPPIVRVEVK
jgi:hypothetical protein